MSEAEHQKATMDLMDKLQASRNPMALGVLDIIQDLHLDIYSVDSANLFRSRLDVLTKLHELSMLYGTITLRQIQDNKWRLGLA